MANIQNRESNMENSLIKNNGEGLVFLISLSRAGSTLLQKILGTHQDIHTCPEPWIMLHPLYALKNSGLNTEYDFDLSRMGTTGLLDQVPEKEELYYSAVSEMAAKIYNRVTSVSGKKMFLDKTPRYYNIIPELYRTFPKAKYIILYRNPFAALSSMLKTWFASNVQVFKRSPNFRDIINGPGLLVEGVKILKDNAIVVHYEKIVKNPEFEIENLCKKIGIPFNKEIINYQINKNEKPLVGDPVGVYKHDKPVTTSIDKWIEYFSHPGLNEFGLEILESLGEPLLQEMGYSYSEIKDSLVSSNGISNENKIHEKVNDEREKPELNDFLENVTSLIEKQNYSDALEYYDLYRPLFPEIYETKQFDEMIAKIKTMVKPSQSEAEFSPKEEKNPAIENLIASLTPETFEKRQLEVENWFEYNLNSELRPKFIKKQEDYFDSQIEKSEVVKTNYKEKDYAISAIVSTYKSEEFIRECLEDLENQTISENLEIVIVDADSPENERKVIEEFQQKYSNIIYIRTPQRIGIYPAWNLAIRASSGKFITPFSTNDRLRKDAYELLLNGFNSDQNLKLVYGNSYLTEKPHETFEKFTPTAHYDGVFEWPATYNFEEHMRTCLVGPHPLWKSEIHSYIGYFNEKYIAIGDQDLYIRVGEEYPLKNINEYTGLYYLSNSGLSVGGHKPDEELDDIFSKYQKRYAIRGVDSNLKECKETNSIAYSDFYNKNGLSSFNKKDYSNALKSFTKSLLFNPISSETFNNMGVLAWELKQTKDAVGLFKQSLEYSPCYIDALNNLLNASNSLGDNEIAIPYIKKAIELEPENSKIKELL